MKFPWLGRCVFNGKDVGITSSASADGNERRNIYRDEKDRLRFLGLLSEMGEKIVAEKNSAMGKVIARFQERVKSDVRLRTLLHKSSSTLSYVQSDPFYVR
jgi:hypothetical protein